MTVKKKKKKKNPQRSEKQNRLKKNDLLDFLIKLMLKHSVLFQEEVHSGKQSAALIFCQLL